MRISFAIICLLLTLAYGTGYYIPVANAERGVSETFEVDVSPDPSLDDTLGAYLRERGEDYSILMERYRPQNNGEYLYNYGEITYLLDFILQIIKKNNIQINAVSSNIKGEEKKVFYTLYSSLYIGKKSLVGRLYKLKNDFVNIGLTFEISIDNERFVLKDPIVFCKEVNINTSMANIGAKYLFEKYKLKELDDLLSDVLNNLGRAERFEKNGIVLHS